MLLPVQKRRLPDGRLALVGASPGSGLALANGGSRPQNSIQAAQLPAAIKRRVNSGRSQDPQPYQMTWGPPIKYVQIPHGEAGTRETLKVMKRLVLSPWGHRNPEVVWLARGIVDEVSPGPQKDYRAMAEKILAFMKENVSYRLDPAGLEYVPTPWYTLLVSGREDCDGHATAIAALAMALGMRAGFRTVKGDKSRPEQWSHVYAVIGVPEGNKTVWLTADSTQEESYLGWDPPEGKVLGMKTWVITPGLEDMQWDT